MLVLPGSRPHTLNNPEWKAAELKYRKFQRTNPIFYPDMIANVEGPCMFDADYVPPPPPEDEEEDEE